MYKHTQTCTQQQTQPYKMTQECVCVCVCVCVCLTIVQSLCVGHFTLVSLVLGGDGGELNVARVQDGRQDPVHRVDLLQETHKHTQQHGYITITVIITITILLIIIIVSTIIIIIISCFFALLAQIISFITDLFNNHA